MTQSENELPTTPPEQDNRNDARAPSATAGKPSADEADTPALEKVRDYLMFGLSLPERAIRSTSAMVSGAVIESASLLVPQAFRSSKTYTTFVEQMLDFMAHDVGGVDRKQNAIVPEVENYVAKKTVGGFIELAALPLLHVSPMTVLAIVSDVAYGSQTYLKELADELKTQGVIDEDSTIDHASDLLEALKSTTATAADALDKPPLSIEGLANTIEQVTKASENSDVTQAIPRREVERLWNDMHRLASEEDKSVLEISSAMSMYAMNRVGQLGQGALSTITVAGNMFDRHILDHYRAGVTELNEKGYYNVLAESSRPYIAAVWKNFSNEKETLTEDFLSGRMLSRTWKSVSGWLAGSTAEAVPGNPPDKGESDHSQTTELEIDPKDEGHPGHGYQNETPSP